MKKKTKFEITRQRGFADREDHWTIEKNGEFIQDDDGNVLEFDSFESAKMAVNKLKRMI
jgi:hypothetical protein